MRDVVTGIERHVHASPTAMAPWWGDLYDHVLRAAEWTDSLRDMIAFMVETQMSLMDWRLNIVMKKLAGWAAIIAVPTAITGWFGQNLPFWGYGSGIGLWASLGLVIASTLVLYWSFRRRDWL
jgi:magnesium transporter